MSASDAAPLPRLGDVFFDVRGDSRSMRLSWYADTGIAVFSIWQGGKCTGTFRLPIDDLARMVEILRRGPESPRPRSDDTAYTQEAGYPQEPGYAQDYRQDRRYGADRDYGDQLGYGHDRRYSRGPDYGESPNYGNERGYGSERVAPPYVGGTGSGDPYRTGDYSTGNSSTSGTDRGSHGHRAYQPDRPAGPSPAGQYDEPPWSPAGYSDDPDYRLSDDGLTADQPAGTRHSAGPHSQR